MKVKCEKCGSIMETKKEHGTVAYVCPNCGFGYATIYLEPIAEDNTLYEVYIDNNVIEKDVFSVLSKITGKNFIEIKSAIENGNYIYKNSAVKIKEVKDILDTKGIKYTINPKFPY